MRKLLLNTLCSCLSEQVMKESFTIVKPQIAEDFVTKLKKKMNETENGDFLIGHDDLNECVGELARNIMTRERHNFDR